MKKSSKLASLTLAAFSIGIVIPGNIDFSTQRKTEEGILCAISPSLDLSKKYVFEEIRPIIDSAYKCTPEKSDYLNRNVLFAVIKKESDYNPRAVSGKGARGLMQIMEGTWDEQTAKMFIEPISFNYAFDPKMNLRVGINYLSELNTYLSENHPSWEKLNGRRKRELILTAYNGGIGRLTGKNWNPEKMYGETRRYVYSIETSLAKFEE